MTLGNGRQPGSTHRVWRSSQTKTRHEENSTLGNGGHSGAGKGDGWVGGRVEKQRFGLDFILWPDREFLKGFECS